MNALTLAASHVEHVNPEEPRKLADVFAQELLDKQNELEAMRLKYEEAARQMKRLVHERDQAEERARKAESTALPVWPLAAVCDGCNVGVVAVSPMPEEAALAEAMRALRWRTVGGKHLCPACGKEQRP